MEGQWKFCGHICDGFRIGPSLSRAQPGPQGPVPGVVWESQLLFAEWLRTANDSLAWVSETYPGGGHLMRWGNGGLGREGTTDLTVLSGCLWHSGDLSKDVPPLGALLRQPPSFFPRSRGCYMEGGISAPRPSRMASRAAQATASVGAESAPGAATADAAAGTKAARVGAGRRGRPRPRPARRASPGLSSAARGVLGSRRPSASWRRAVRWEATPESRGGAGAASTRRRRRPSPGPKRCAARRSALASRQHPCPHLAQPVPRSAAAPTPGGTRTARAGAWSVRAPPRGCRWGARRGGSGSGSAAAAKAAGQGAGPRRLQNLGQKLRSCRRRRARALSSAGTVVPSRGAHCGGRGAQEPPPVG